MYADVNMENIKSFKVKLSLFNIRKEHLLGKQCFFGNTLSLLVSNSKNKQYSALTNFKFLIVWIKLNCARFCVQQKTGFVCFQNIEASLDLRPPIDFHLRTEIASRINWENECFADRWMKIDKVDCNFCFWQKLFGFSSFGERQDRRLTPRSQIRPNSVK